MQEGYRGPSGRRMVFLIEGSHFGGLLLIRKPSVYKSFRIFRRAPVETRPLEGHEAPSGIFMNRRSYTEYTIVFILSWALKGLLDGIQEASRKTWMKTRVLDGMDSGGGSIQVAFSTWNGSRIFFIHFAGLFFDRKFCCSSGGSFRSFQMEGLLLDFSEFFYGEIALRRVSIQRRPLVDLSVVCGCGTTSRTFTNRRSPAGF